MTGVTYGAAPLTFIDAGISTDANTKYRAELWYLVAPTVGTDTITVSFSGTDAIDAAVGGSASYFGVDQGAPLGLPGNAGGTNGCSRNVSSPCASRASLQATLSKVLFPP